jgi:hypothetical protein
VAGAGPQRNDGGGAAGAGGAWDCGDAGEAVRVRGEYGDRGRGTSDFRQIRLR